MSSVSQTESPSPVHLGQLGDPGLTRPLLLSVSQELPRSTSVPANLSSPAFFLPPSLTHPTQTRKTVACGSRGQDPRDCPGSPRAPQSPSFETTNFDLYQNTDPLDFVLSGHGILMPPTPALSFFSSDEEELQTSPSMPTTPCLGSPPEEHHFHVHADSIHHGTHPSAASNLAAQSSKAKASTHVSGSWDFFGKAKGAKAIQRTVGGGSKQASRPAPKCEKIPHIEDLSFIVHQDDEEDEETEEDYRQVSFVY